MQDAGRARRRAHRRQVPCPQPATDRVADGLVVAAWNATSWDGVSVGACCGTPAGSSVSRSSSSSSSSPSSSIAGNGTTGVRESGGYSDLYRRCDDKSPSGSTSSAELRTSFCPGGRRGALVRFSTRGFRWPPPDFRRPSSDGGWGCRLASPKADRTRPATINPLNPGVWLAQWRIRSDLPPTRARTSLHDTCNLN